jgi:PIN domain nuclease of toxin-antitoxin system
MTSEPWRLSSRASAVCEREEITLSVASVWEIGIKSNNGGLELPEEPAGYISKQIRIAGLSVLPINYRHAMHAASLPLKHKDPFDRMLAAQSIEEKLPFVTRDPIFREYGVETIW